jgi:ribose transport system ATP-binding protein
MPDDGAPRVRMTGICKSYPGVRALHQASIAVREGEIKALVGENGAGKSTLMKILTGAETPDAGTIEIGGRAFDRMTPALSDRLGVACVYQNMMLAEHLTVAENIWMGHLPAKGGFLSPRRLRDDTDRILREIGYAGIIDPRSRVADLTASRQGMVAIVRAVSRNARIIIFDEPTAMLADREVEELFKVIRLLRERKLAILYISHRMEEIFDLCDRYAVLKDGETVGEGPLQGMTEDRLIALMVGREVTGSNYDATRSPGEELLRAEDVTTDRVSGCSLSLREGEIVGLYGLVGAGRTELSRALFGRDRIRSGTVRLRGQPVRLSTPRRAIDHRIGLVPEDRRRQGLALQLSVKHNLNLPVYRRTSLFGLIRPGVERAIGDRYIRDLAIKTPSPDQKVRHLSGGNQQKVVLGKWLATESRIFILDEPTNGVDVGAKAEIYALINRLAREKAGILFISSYMPELMDVCDRILVMNGGRLVADVPRTEFKEETLLSHAIRTRQD